MRPPIAAVKLQGSTPCISVISKPIYKVYPQKEEILEVLIDQADPNKVVRIGLNAEDNYRVSQKERINLHMDNLGHEGNQPNSNFTRVKTLISPASQFHKSDRS